MSRQDKAKSAGLFSSTLFSRSTKRGGGGYAHNGKGTRPVSANESEGLDAQEIENTILRMTVEEINQKFRLLLEDMNIPKEKLAPLMKKNLDEKRDMIRMQLKGI